jgi:hypothetical protein
MLGYRTLFQVQGGADSAIEESVREFRHWMSTKVNRQYEGDSVEFGIPKRFGDDAAVIFLREEQPDGSRAVRATLTEVNQVGRWTTRLTVGAPRERPAWVWVDVDGPAERPDGSGNKQWTSTPRLAKSLLEMFDAHDGLAPLRVRPERAFVDDIDGIVDMICDPDRRGLLFLAGSAPDTPLDLWSNEVSNVLKETAGLAGAFVLDSDATRELEDAVGPGHAVPPGTIRTFRAGADPASALHRILGEDRLSNDDHRYLSRMLGWGAREAAIEEPLTKAARRLDSRFEEMTNAILVDRVYMPVVVDVPRQTAVDSVATDVGRILDESVSAAVEVPTDVTTVVTAEAEFLTRLAAALSQVTGRDLALGDPLAELARLASFAVAADGLLAAQEDLTRRLDELSDGVHHAAEVLAEVRRRLDDEQLDHAETAQELVRANATRDRLRTELTVLGKGEMAWTTLAVDPVSELPDSFSTLIRRLPELFHLKFTGDPDFARDLESHDSMGTWAAKAWQALLAANSYASAKASGEFAGSMEMYLQETPAGLPGYSRQRHARDESEPVKKSEKYRLARVFPVPTTVETDGQVYMGAHFKIAQFGMISPRIHYWDATAIDGRLYVGYIGAHLPTARTN